MKAEIRISSAEVAQAVLEYVRKRTNVEASAVQFKIEERTEGDYRDSWKVSELKEAIVTVELKP